MNILTVYAESAAELLSVMDDIARKVYVKVLAADPERLYNDANHDDVNLPAITFSTDTDHKGVIDLVKSCHVYVCEENPEDWE